MRCAARTGPSLARNTPTALDRCSASSPSRRPHQQFGATSRVEQHRIALLASTPAESTAADAARGRLTTPAEARRQVAAPRRAAGPSPHAARVDTRFPVAARCRGSRLAGPRERRAPAQRDASKHHPSAGACRRFLELCLSCGKPGANAEAHAAGGGACRPAVKMALLWRKVPCESCS